MFNINDLINKHGSVLTINTKNIKNNYKILKNFASKSIVAAVVKSNAYGILLDKIIKILIEASCKDFFVATLDEAILARQLSKNINIYVLHGIFGNTEQIFWDHNLIPVLNSINQINKWYKFAKIKKQQLPCIIHVDTGINRLGLQKEELIYLKENYCDIAKYININYIISHLSCADNKNNEFNKIQYNEFINITKNFPNIKKSLAASYGIFLDKKYHFDMIRPGFALYGSNPQPTFPNPMLPVIGYYSSVIKINTIHKGEKIGYSHNWEANRLSKVATITVGYADGIIRSCYNNAQVYINNKRAPIVGIISMDSVMIDVTDINENIVEGTIVEIIGENQDIDKFSQMNATISCETFNILGNRYPKVYY